MKFSGSAWLAHHLSFLHCQCGHEHMCHLWGGDKLWHTQLYMHATRMGSWKFTDAYWSPEFMRNAEPGPTCHMVRTGSAAEPRCARKIAVEPRVCLPMCS